MMSNQDIVQYHHNTPPPLVQNNTLYTLSYGKSSRSDEILGLCNETGHSDMFNNALFNLG